MRKFKLIPVAAILAAVLQITVPDIAAAQETTAKIHGHAQDPVGAPIAQSIITLSSDGGKTAKYTFTADANGDYKGDGIAPGTYTVSLRKADTPPDKVIDQFLSIKIIAGQDVTQDFDLGRPEYVSKLTPEQKKQMEEVKQKNAEANKENQVIKNLNANLIKARDDNKNKNYAEAETLMSQATQAKPEASVLWLELGVAQAGLKKYDEAVVSLKKSIETDLASKKQNPEIQGAAGNALGEVLGTEKKNAEAQAAYDAAAKANPAAAGMYYQNETIVFAKSGGDVDATVAAAEKAIAAAPEKPLPYYLKGQALINKASVDPKTGKIAAPPGCAEAYQKYLELAPDGPYANDAKSVLTEMGQTIKSTYKAKK